MTPQDYKSDQPVRWCAGCGDHAVLNSLHKAMAAIGVPPQMTAVISGIGCSSRLPYYMNTYGFHTIHGRAAAVATGFKVANPAMTVKPLYPRNGSQGILSCHGGKATSHACLERVSGRTGYERELPPEA